MTLYVGITRTTVRHIPRCPISKKVPRCWLELSQQPHSTNRQCYPDSGLQLPGCLHRTPRLDIPCRLSNIGRQIVCLRSSLALVMVQIRSGTLAERYQDGVRLRRNTPREKHADLRGAADRDAVAILRATRRATITTSMTCNSRPRIEAKPAIATEKSVPEQQAKQTCAEEAGTNPAEQAPAEHARTDCSLG
jgi:hypothetical protein